jgi:hypothetical protein
MKCSVLIHFGWETLPPFQHGRGAWPRPPGGAAAAAAQCRGAADLVAAGRRGRAGPWA